MEVTQQQLSSAGPSRSQGPSVISKTNDMYWAVVLVGPLELLRHQEGSGAISVGGREIAHISDTSTS
jgi:hypothetical protein